MIDLSSFAAALDDTPFEETPVDLDTFIGPGYLGDQFILSDIQRDLIEAMSQIYKLDDLIRLMGVEAGTQHFKKYTKKEVIMLLGKGAGKDFTSTVGCAYLVYKLLCLKDPARYFGKVAGDAIDIINIAINAEQARNVFFKGFKTRISKAPWFQGRFDPKTNAIEFDKAITVYSGHSEKESHEGLNLILAILDEISGFSMANNSGNMNAKTGDAIYRAFRGSVDSRFPDYGKVVLLSFPRYKGDFISEHYDNMVKDKRVHLRQHTYVIDPEKPPVDDNLYTIEWEEDEIFEYTIPGKIMAVKAPSWEVNPGRDIEDYKDAFLVNPQDAYQRFACKPQGIEGGLFKDLDRLKQMMFLRNPISSTHVLDPSWAPQHDKTYYLHADLAQKRDRCAVAMAHVEKFVKQGVIMGEEWIVPQVVVDFVAWWETDPLNPLDLSIVADWIVDLRKRGIVIGKATTDRWNSVDFQKQLTRLNVNTGTLSVNIREYDDLVLTVADGRAMLPDVDLLYTELSQLQIINDRKVDHPRSGSKDLADAVAGAVHNAVANTPRHNMQEVDIVDYSMVRSRSRRDSVEQVEERPAVPSDIEAWLNRMGTI